MTHFLSTLPLLAGMGLAGAAADVMPIKTVFLIGGLFTLAGGIVGPFVLREPGSASIGAKDGTQTSADSAD